MAFCQVLHNIEVHTIKYLVFLNKISYSLFYFRQEQILSDGKLEKEVWSKKWKQRTKWKQRKLWEGAAGRSGLWIHATVSCGILIQSRARRTAHYQRNSIHTLRNWHDCCMHLLCFWGSHLSRKTAVTPEKEMHQPRHQVIENKYWFILIINEHFIFLTRPGNTWMKIFVVTVDLRRICQWWFPCASPCASTASFFRLTHVFPHST